MKILYSFCYIFIFFRAHFLTRMFALFSIHSKIFLFSPGNYSIYSLHKLYHSQIIQTRGNKSCKLIDRVFSLSPPRLKIRLKRKRKKVAADQNHREYVYKVHKTLHTVLTAPNNCFVNFMTDL